MKVKIIIAVAVLLIGGVVTYGIMNDWQFTADNPESVIEQRLKNPELIPKLSWNDLYTYDWQNNTGPEDLMQYDGQLVKIPGYIVPLTDSWSILDDFLLVPDAQACIHVPPPPPNLIVDVKLREAVSFEEVYNPSWVIGIFRVEETFSVHGESAFTLDGIKVEKFVWEGY